MLCRAGQLSHDLDRLVALHVLQECRTRGALGVLKMSSLCPGGYCYDAASLTMGAVGAVLDDGCETPPWVSHQGLWECVGSRGSLRYLSCCALPRAVIRGLYSRVAELGAVHLCD